MEPTHHNVGTTYRLGKSASNGYRWGMRRKLLHWGPCGNLEGEPRLGGRLLKGHQAAPPLELENPGLEPFRCRNLLHLKADAEPS